MGLFRALTREEIGSGFCEDEADGEVGVVRESVENVGYFNGCYGTAGCEKEMVFPVIGIGGGCE